MAYKHYNSQDFNENELINIVLQTLASDPATSAIGRTYFNSAVDELRIWNGTSWVSAGGGGGGDVNSIETATTNGQAVLFDGTGGKTIKKSTKNGLIKEVSGVPEEAVAGTDYVTADSNNTFTNKTFDAQGTGNALSNIVLTNFASGVVATDLSTSASSSQLARADAVKTYVDNTINGLAGGLIFKGGWDASGGSFPGSGSAEKGWYYKVTISGTVDSVDFQVGDTLFAEVDNASTTTYAGNWFKVDNTEPEASETVKGIIEIANDTEAENGTDDLKAMTPKKVADNYPRKFFQTFVVADWVGASAPFTLTYNSATHGRGSNAELLVQVRELDTDYKAIEVSNKISTAGTVTIESQQKFDGSIIIIG